MDHHLQPIMKQRETYKIEVPKGAILVTADVVGLNPSIPHSEGLNILKKQYETYPDKEVSTEDTGKMVDSVLKNQLV